MKKAPRARRVMGNGPGSGLRLWVQLQVCPSHSIIWHFRWEAWERATLIHHRTSNAALLNVFSHVGEFDDPVAEDNIGRNAWQSTLGKLVDCPVL